MSKIKPGREPCPKCGELDICRVYYDKGDELTRSWGTKPTGKTTEFVARPAYDWKAKKDCIVHHCRICQYSWDGPCLS